MHTLFLLAALSLFAGCATRPQPGTRTFQFETDTFAYENQLVWEYGYDEAGNWFTQQREEKPDYSLRCFVVARSARQFFHHARFAPELPKVDEAEYVRLVKRVIARDPRRTSPPEKLIVIPGYANLREFSLAQEQVLKANCGGAIQSYVQRGNWRTTFPFSRRGQEQQVEQLIGKLAVNWPPIVHVVDFPKLTINHALLVYSVQEGPAVTRFEIYDPNNPETPGTLYFDREKRQFVLPALNYFRGGKVNVYEVYHRWNY